MKVKYDKEVKAIYIELMDIPDGGVAHTEELVADTVFIDRNKAGDICGIEVLGVEEVLKK